MRRLMIAVIVVGVVLSNRIVCAQDSRPASIPPKVHNALRYLVGTWSLEHEADDVVYTDTMTSEWGPEQHHVISRDAHSTYLVGWDGSTLNGIVMYRVGREGFHHVTHAEIVSDTLMEGKGKVMIDGQSVDHTARMVREGPDKMVYTASAEVDGQMKTVWKTVSTRVKTTDDEQELIRLAAAWEDCLVTRDVAMLDRLWAEEYTSGTPDGKVRSKKQSLAEIQSDDLKITAAACENLQARVYGDMGVTTGIAVEKGRYKDYDISGKYRFTDTWIKRDGRWQCVATHASKIAEGMENKALEGAWRLAEYDYGDDSEEELQAIKAYWNGTFYCTFYDAETGKIESAHGGTYTYDGKTLAETIGFANVEELGPYLGTTVTFKVDVKDGKFYQSGDFAGTPLKEVWQSVTLKP